MALLNHLPWHRKNGEAVEYGEIATREELLSLIDREAHRLLGISGAEFLELRAQGRLPERPGARTLAMLAELESVS